MPKSPANINGIEIFHFLALFPLAVGWCIYQKNVPTLFDVLIGMGTHTALTSGPMSFCLHRYFSHNAFQANRVVGFFLAVAACLAYQYGPVWWSSKHRRHHRYCDQPKDPHSWGQTSLWYAWSGWTLSKGEQHIDTEYVSPHLKTESGKIRPELLLVDRFWWLPTLLMHLWLHFAMGISFNALVWRYSIPTCLCPAATLWFNCQFHPPTNTAAGKICKAVDVVWDPLCNLHGEAHHNDHHEHPSKAHRPGIDACYYMFVLPLMSFGLIQEKQKSSA